MEKNTVTLDLALYHELNDFHREMNKDMVYLYDGWGRIITKDEAIKHLAKEHKTSVEILKEKIRTLENDNAVLRSEGVRNIGFWKFIKMKWL